MGTRMKRIGRIKKNRNADSTDGADLHGSRKNFVFRFSKSAFIPARPAGGRLIRQIRVPILSFKSVHPEKCSGRIPIDFFLFTDQFSNFKGHICKNDPWVAVHLYMIKSRFKDFGQFNDVALIDKW